MESEYPGQRRLSRLQTGQRRVVRIGAAFDDRAEGLLDDLGMLHKFGLPFQILLLASDKCGIMQFVEEETVIVEIAARLCLRSHKRLELAFERGVVAVFELVVGPRRIARVEAVEQKSLEARFGEGERLMLRVYVDQPRCHLFHHRQRHGSVVDESARLGAGQHLAAQDERGVVVEVVLGEERLHAESLDIEPSLDYALLLAVVESRRVGPLTQHQSEGTEEYRLSSTGLAGDGGEAVTESDVRLSDERIVLYMK